MSSENEFMKLRFYVRMFKDGKWQPTDIQEMSNEEFRQFICWKLGLVGMKEEG